jgi:dihydrofolate reductase
MEMDEGTTFYFVTEGIESALERARNAAGGKDVMLWGGGNPSNSAMVLVCSPTAGTPR